MQLEEDRKDCTLCVSGREIPVDCTEKQIPHQNIHLEWQSDNQQSQKKTANTLDKSNFFLQL